MKRLVAGYVLGLGLALAMPAALAQQRQPAAANRMAERAITVVAHAFDGFSVLDSSRRKFGKLTFLGGLELRSKDPNFGGISSAIIDSDGLGFIALSDHAHWITGRFTAKDGALTGLEDVRIQPMTAPNGRRMKDTQWFDSEGLTRIGNRLYVSVERVHTILRFEMANGRPTGRGTPIDVPPDLKTLTTNQGIEALGVMPARSPAAGALIGISERASTGVASDDIPGWLIGGRTPGQFHVKRKANFDVTDLGFLPDGDMLVLERRFAPFSGLGMRIRRIALGEIKPGAILDGETLIEADMSHQIDNMEALMIHQDQRGRTIITLMSDDNFSLLQRNIVLRFAYDP